ncbi:MAG: hypothetical protein HQ478_07035 [Chloroflexi bacterium]|nr:hypothetical protein [Chloroflexota bacterium]
MIAASPKGPRADGKCRGPDSYENAVLLCPTHHTLVDKAPSTHPVELMQAWKRAVEEYVKVRLDPHHVDNLEDFRLHINKLLTQNISIHRSFGPESEEASRNPLSPASKIWVLRKLAFIVPNNRHIVNCLNNHEKLFSVSDWEVVVEFIEHAETFELNCFERMDGSAVPRFPKRFAILMGQT